MDNRDWVNQDRDPNNGEDESDGDNELDPRDNLPGIGTLWLPKPLYSPGGHGPKLSPAYAYPENGYTSMDAALAWQKGLDYVIPDEHEMYFDEYDGDSDRNV